MQIERLLALKMMSTATPEQKLEYEMLGALARAQMVIRVYNNIKEAIGEDGLQNLLQQKSGANSAEGSSQSEES